MEAIGYEEYFFGEGVCLVEWSELIEELIPESQTNENKDWMALFTLVGFSLMMCLDVALG